MEIISWNIQAALGTDGVTDTDRIAAVMRAMGDPDLICLQEIGQRFGRPDDQVEQLARQFPDHTAFFGPAIDRLSDDGASRERFGNVILSRLPVLHTARHRLPQPADPEHLNMPRQATEVVVPYGAQLCRVLTTHLEYFAAPQRSAQADYLAQTCADACRRAAHRSPTLVGKDGAYASAFETALTVVCGDFNCEPGSADYRRLLADDGLLDAWRLVHGDAEHAPTCGIFDHRQWPDGAHCRDFFLLTPELKDAVSGLAVNVDTNASDHQPLLLTLRPPPR